MEQSGDITIVSPEATLETTYSISTDDGRACINGWDVFMADVPALVVKERALMVLYLGNNGAFLFVRHVPVIELK